MHTDLHINEPFSVKKGPNASAKIIDPRQPVQSAQADLGKYFLLLVNFLDIKAPYYLKIHLTVKTESRMSKSESVYYIQIKPVTEYRPNEHTCIVTQDVFGSSQNNSSKMGFYRLNSRF